MKLVGLSNETINTLKSMFDVDAIVDISVDETVNLMGIAEGDSRLTIIIHASRYDHE